MKIYIVASTAISWMNTGFGHSLLHADANELLVSFAEFSTKPDQQLAITSMKFPYEPKADQTDPPTNRIPLE